MIICGPDSLCLDGSVYHLPYIEVRARKRHGYMTRQGVVWTRSAEHPADPRCPECNAARSEAVDSTREVRRHRGREALPRPMGGKALRPVDSVVCSRLRVHRVDDAVRQPA